MTTPSDRCNNKDGNSLILFDTIPFIRPNDKEIEIDAAYVTSDITLLAETLLRTSVHRAYITVVGVAGVTC
jgi:hypothetical protein